MQKGKNSRASRTRQEQIAHENTSRLSLSARPGRNGNVGAYSFGLPSIQDAPRGAHVVEANGPHAVALCRNGVYLGIHRRT